MDREGFDRLVAEVEVDDEYRELQRRCFDGLWTLNDSGIFCCELGGREYDELWTAYGIVDELVKVKDGLLGGDYPQVGEPLESLELHGLYRCYYRYAYGVEYVNYFRSFEFKEIPIVRLYINQRLVGLFILGRRVVDFYLPYVKWLQESGTNLPIMGELV